MLLADRAQLIDGKLHVVGGGWTVMGPGPTAVALALTIEVPWHGGESVHEWRISLLDEDGRDVPCSEHGTHPIERAGSFRLQPLDDQAAGSSTSTVLAVPFGTLELAPGRGYVWRFELDGQSSPSWRLSFRCRA